MNSLADVEAFLRFACVFGLLLLGLERVCSR